MRTDLACLQDVLFLRRLHTIRATVGQLSGCTGQHNDHVSMEVGHLSGGTSMHIYDTFMAVEYAAMSDIGAIGYGRYGARSSHR